MIENKKLLEYEYYLRRMSLFMNESIGFKERTKILYDILISIDNFYNELFNRINVINNKNYYSDFNIEEQDNATSSDEGAIQDGDGNWFIPNTFLDLVGSIFDVKRSFTIKTCELNVDGTYTNLYPINETDIDDDTYKFISLNNRDYLLYLKLSIVKMYFNGTRENLEEIYKSDARLLSFLYVTQFNCDSFPLAQPGNVMIYWNISPNSDLDTYGTTMRYIFLNGLLTVESLGIIYQRAILTLTSMAIFDSSIFGPDEHEGIWG